MVGISHVDTIDVKNEKVKALGFMATLRSHLSGRAGEI